MTKLIALLAVAGAIGAAIFFWRRNPDSWRAGWSSAKDSTSSWGTTATDAAGRAADRVSGTAEGADAASDFADAVKGGISQAAHEAGGAVDSAGAAAVRATEEASNLADEVRGDTSR
jgi:hypothetical protein